MSLWHIGSDEETIDLEELLKERDLIDQLIQDIQDTDDLGIHTTDHLAHTEDFTQDSEDTEDTIDLEEDIKNVI